MSATILPVSVGNLQPTQMPMHYIRKTDKASYSKDQMHRAVTVCKNGEMGVRRAAKEFGVPKSTLAKKVKEAKNGNEHSVRLGRKPTLPLESEAELAQVILDMEARGVGIYRKDVRALAYEFAVGNNLRHDFNHKTKMAGRFWLAGFLKRYPDIVPRKAEGISKARARGMNWQEVGKYIDRLGNVMDHKGFHRAPERETDATLETSLMHIDQQGQRSDDVESNTPSTIQGHQDETICLTNSMEIEDECAGDDYTNEKNDDDTTERKEMEIDPSEERENKFVEEPENTNSDDYCDTKDTGDGLHRNEMVVLLSEGELKFVIKQEPEDTDGHTNVNRCDSFLPSVHWELQSFIKEKPVNIEEECLISNTKEESADSYEGSFLHEPQLCSNQGGNPSIQSTSQGTGNTGDISGDTSCDRSHGKHLQEEVPLQSLLGNQSDLTEKESSSSSESLLPNKVDSPEGESATTSSSVLNSDGRRLDGNTDSTGNKFCCSICNEEFKSRDCWWSHVKIHWEDKSYKCTYCEERFRKHNDLRNHLTIHAEERLQVSDKLFDDDSNLQSSVVVYINEKQDHCSSKDKSSKEDARIEKYYKCSSCESLFQSSDALKRHMASHLECFSCKKVFAKFDQLKYHIMMSHKGENPSLLRPNQCFVCKKSCHTPGELKSHMGIHKEKVQYQCLVCEAVFSRYDWLNAHMRMHTEERQYECSECKEVFHRADLRMHVRSHNVEWPKKCSLCEDSFTSWAHLIGHRLKHTGEKPYLCSICKEDFTRKFDVDRHMEIHTQEKPSDMNKNTREGLFECPECKKTFSKAHCLKRHIQTHTGEEPWKCAECGECFSFSGQLKVHQIKHTGIKPYLCSICGKDFWQKQYLTDHMNNHMGEKPYICSFCSKSFKSKAYLRSHILTCH